MTEHGIGTDSDRLAAHERLSTGALASWMRACASHPWRVVLSWLGIIVALFVLVLTIGGSLKDEFSIPGSDTQRATDLIESEFVEEQGGVLNLVFAAPPGERLDTPERRAAVEGAIAELKTDEFAPTGEAPEGDAGVTSVGDPFDENTFSDDGRIAYAEAQFDRVIYTEDRPQVEAVEEAVREAVEPAGVTVEFNGDAEFPPIEQGIQEALGLLAALIVLLIVFRTLVAGMMPIALALVALLTAFLLLFILAGFTDINTITPLLVSMIGLGVGIDYSLLIVTRFRQLLHEGLSPVDAAAEAGASAGRATLFAGLTVAISVSGLAFFGLDFVTKLGIGSALGVLTTVLLANSLLIAILARIGERARNRSPHRARHLHAWSLLVVLGVQDPQDHQGADRAGPRRTPRSHSLDPLLSDQRVRDPCRDRPDVPAGRQGDAADGLDWPLALPVRPPHRPGVRLVVEGAGGDEPLPRQ